MPDAPCTARCGRPADGYYLCRWCADELHHSLGTVPTLADELDITVTRQTALGDPLPVSNPSTVQPLPYDPNAAECVWVLRDTLTVWAHVIADHIGHTVDAGDLPALADWLRARVHSVRTHTAAGECFDELCHAIRYGWSTVDRRIGWVFIGPCTSDGCTADLYARADPDNPGRIDPHQTVVSCRDCGARWNAETRRDWLLEQLRDATATAREIACAAGTIAGREINVKTIRSWCHQGRIAIRGRTPGGRPLHRIGDVVDVATRTPTRHRRTSHRRPKVGA